LRFPVHEPFEYYLKASGYGTADKVAAAAQQWGLNQFEVSRGSCQMSAACLPQASCLQRLNQGPAGRRVWAWQVTTCGQAAF
jgi:hypothetical protein